MKNLKGRIQMIILEKREVKIKWKTLENRANFQLETACCHWFRRKNFLRIQGVVHLIGLRGFSSCSDIFRRRNFCSVFFVDEPIGSPNQQNQKHNCGNNRKNIHSSLILNKKHNYQTKVPKICLN